MQSPQEDWAGKRTHMNQWKQPFGNSGLTEHVDVEWFVLMGKISF